MALLVELETVLAIADAKALTECSPTAQATYVKIANMLVKRRCRRDFAEISTNEDMEEDVQTMVTRMAEMLAAFGQDKDSKIAGYASQNIDGYSYALMGEIEKMMPIDLLMLLDYYTVKPGSWSEPSGGFVVGGSQMEDDDTYIGSWNNFGKLG